MADTIIPRFNSEAGSVYEDELAPDPLHLNWVRPAGFLVGFLVGLPLTMIGAMGSAFDTPRNGYAGFGKATDHLLVTAGFALLVGMLSVSFAAYSLQERSRRRRGIICTCAAGNGEDHFHVDDRVQAELQERAAELHSDADA